MRILLVTHYYPEHAGGIEIIAHEIASRLARRGAAVRWAASASEGPADPPGITRLPMTACNVTERRWGIPYPIWSPASVARLAAAARTCDLVHLHDYHYFGSAAAAAAARLARRPVVVTQHVGWVPYRGRVPRILQTVANRVLGPLVLGGADRSVFYGEHVRSHFARFIRFRRPVRFIPTGVDHTRFRPPAPTDRARLRAELGLPAGRPVVLFVGRFVEKKGLDRVRELAARFPEAEWLLIGWGPERPERWGLPNVRCVGRVHQHGLVGYYQAVDLVVLPSVGEGLPLVVQEAMACGTPVLISRETAAAMPGLADVAVVADLAEGDLADRFRAAVADPDGLRDRAATAAAFARRHWSWARCADEYHELFSELVRRPAGTRGG